MLKYMSKMKLPGFGPPWQSRDSRG